MIKGYIFDSCVKVDSKKLTKNIEYLNNNRHTFKIRGARCR